MSTSPHLVDIHRRERVFAKSPSSGERTVALSLLDATTANFALTNACKQQLLECKDDLSNDS